MISRLYPTLLCWFIFFIFFFFLSLCRLKIMSHVINVLTKCCATIVNRNMLLSVGHRHDFWPQDQNRLLFPINDLCENMCEYWISIVDREWAVSVRSEKKKQSQVIDDKSIRDISFLFFFFGFEFRFTWT